MGNTGKRELNRIERNRSIIAAATEITARDGVHGLTMHQVAKQVDCAVGTIYTYFGSKSALLARLQSDAVEALTESYTEAKGIWADSLESVDLGSDGAQIKSLARVIAMSRLFIAWPELHELEFSLLQMFISTPERLIDQEDLEVLLPQVLMLIFDVSQLIEDVVSTGAVGRDDSDSADNTLARTLRWAGGLNGAVQIHAASAPVQSVNPAAFGLEQLAVNLTTDLLRGWGAQREQIQSAKEVVAGMDQRSELIPAAL